MVTISPAIDRFLASAGVADATRLAYRRDLHEFADWYGERPVEDVDVRVLADWTTHLGAARRGVPTPDR